MAQTGATGIETEQSPAVGSEKPENSGCSESSGQSTLCLNCQTPLQGKFCFQCSQRNIGNRLKAPELFHNFIEAITNTDFRLWHTLRDIVRNPGLVALKYIHGARLTYINPIQFFIWTFALYVGFLAAVGWFDTDIGQGMDVTIDGDKGISEDIKSYMEGLRRVVLEQFDVITFLTMPLFAFGIRWQYYKSGRNFAEVLCFVCFSFGLMHAYGLLIAIGYYVGGLDYAGSPQWITFAVFAYGAKVFFAIKWWKAVLASLVSMFLLGLIKWLVSSALVFIDMVPL